MKPWSVRDWPLRRKVAVVALVPMLLATVFCGLRVADALGDAAQWRLAADRVEVIPATTDYLAALGGALLAASSGGDVEAAGKSFDNRRDILLSRTRETDVIDNVRVHALSITRDGTDLLQRVLDGRIDVRDQVAGFAPILLGVDDIITDSIAGADVTDDQAIRTDATALVGAATTRAQTVMQRLLVDRGGELSSERLQTLMTMLIGSEPTTMASMAPAVSGSDFDDLKQQLFKRMAIITDSTAVLPGNTLLQESLRETNRIAGRTVDNLNRAVRAAVADRAAERHNAAVRDIALTLAALLLAAAVAGWLTRNVMAALSRPDGGVGASPGGAINEAFEALARRNRSLVEQQLNLIGQIERDERDPARLDTLRQMDHLAHRMRRSGTNLLVLADAQLSPVRTGSMSLAGVLGEAAAQVHGHDRVHVAPAPDIDVCGVAADDLAHLVAELIDNALRSSPPTAPVVVTARAIGDGAAIDVVDTGLGMTEADLAAANTRLESAAAITPQTARHMGLFVVSRLADRHGITVWLRAPADGSRGLVALVHLPPELIAGGVDAAEEAEESAHVAAEPEMDTPAPDTPPPDTPPFGTGPFETPEQPPLEPVTESIAEPAPRPAPAPASTPSAVSADEAIYHRMMAESGIDLDEFARLTDVSGTSVWDEGWALAGQAEQIPAVEHTDQGLPIREPGARLVPGSANGTDADRPVPAPHRDPDSVRASIGGHFDGVQAGRSATGRNERGWTGFEADARRSDR